MFPLSSRNLFWF